MKTILFISGNVGIDILQFMLRKGDVPDIMVIDEFDMNERNQHLIDMSGLPSDRIIQNKDLYSQDTLARLKELDLDIGFLVWWPHIVRREITDIVKGVIVNMHPSYLPYNRGKDPNFWAIVDRTSFGATLHYVNAGIDSGDIIARESIPVTWEDTGKTLYDKSLRALVGLFKSNYDSIMSGLSLSYPQDPLSGSIHYRRQLEPASVIEIDKQYSARDLLNIIRAKEFDPHPHAWFEDEGKKYEVSIKITLKKELENDGKDSSK